MIYPKDTSIKKKSNVPQFQKIDMQNKELKWKENNANVFPHGTFQASIISVM